MRFKSNSAIAYRSWGDQNAPLILALHGWLDNADSFELIAPHLAKENYIVAPDLPGHGRSDHKKEQSSYYLWEYAIELLRLIESEKWKQLTILAHSMGTGVASIMASIAPKHFHKIIFIDGIGAPFEIPTDTVAYVRQSYRQAEILRKMKSIHFSGVKAHFKSKEEAIKDRMKSTISPLSYSSSAILVERSLKEVPEGFDWSFDQRMILPEYFRLTERQAISFLSGIQCPVLLILGESGLFDPRIAANRINNIRQSTTFWLKGGHHLHLEEDHLHITSLISIFLNKSK